MSKYTYSENEKSLNKAIKMNQDISSGMLSDESMKMSRDNADKAIASSMELLKSLSLEDKLEIEHKARDEKLTLNMRGFDEIAAEAEDFYDYDVAIEDFMSEEEIKYAIDNLDNINREFSQKTSIINKTDLILLSIATTLQVAKALITPEIAKHFGYGEAADPNTRVEHNDKKIKEEQRRANDEFRDKHSDRYKKGYWVEMLYQSVPYDAIKGSGDLGLGLSGNNHRLKTLGHDPVLGWVFGTANILTDVITLNNFSSYRVQRKPQFKVTNEPVLLPTLFADAIAMVKNDKMNLPAAIFAQAQHLKSDKYTKRGLPIPILSVINENFASKLYDEHYDSLCFERDLGIIAVSAAVSALMNMIISLIHGLFYNENDGISKELYEVRTRKILLISNSIASSSSIIYAAITKNPKNLDIGGLLVTITRLFSDIRFITKVKQEFINSKLNEQLQAEISKLDNLIAELT